MMNVIWHTKEAGRDEVASQFVSDRVASSQEANMLRLFTMPIALSMELTECFLFSFASDIQPCAAVTAAGFRDGAGASRSA